MPLYIVSSGDGHFVRFDNGCPLMDFDPLCAARMEEEQAREVVEQLEVLGLAGRLVKLVFGRGPWVTKE